MWAAGRGAHICGTVSGHVSGAVTCAGVSGVRALDRLRGSCGDRCHVHLVLCLTAVETNVTMIARSVSAVALPAFAWFMHGWLGRGGERGFSLVSLSTLKLMLKLTRPLRSRRDAARLCVCLSGTLSQPLRSQSALSLVPCPRPRCLSPRDCEMDPICTIARASRIALPSWAGRRPWGVGLETLACAALATRPGLRLELRLVHATGCSVQHVPHQKNTVACWDS